MTVYWTTRKGRVVTAALDGFGSPMQWAGKGLPRASRRRFVIPLAFALSVFSDVAGAGAAVDCAGDCDHSGQVTAADILRMNALALSGADSAACVPGDANEDGQISDDDVAQAIHALFAKCAEQPATYDSLAGELYHVDFPTSDVSLIQAAAIVAALYSAGMQDEEELRALVVQLLSDLGVQADRIGQIAIYATREDGDSCEDCLATCHGRCVKGPRGDCFCYEPLSTEPAPSPERIAILLLEQAADEPAALNADRVPCPFALSQGGVNDGFSTANGAEPASPSPGLLAFMQQASSHAPAGFDGTATDRLFGHTFTLPQGKCLQSAKILFRARPLAINPVPASPNDAVHLGFVNAAGQFVGAHWAAYFGTGYSGLPVLLAHQWNPSSYPAPTGASFILDLASLPGGMNLLPDLDTRRSLDFFVQDDTSVDYVSLVARICDCATPTPTASGTPTRTGTVTLTPSRTPTRTATGTLQPTQTVTPTATRTMTSTATYTAAPTGTATGTPTITGTPTKTPMCITPPPNMVAWWPMDETAGAPLLLDIVGTNHATPGASPVGGAQAPQPVGGVVGGAIDFQKFGNGLSGARVSAQGALHAVGSADFTIDAWVKFPPAAVNQRHYVVNKLQTNPNLGYGLYVVSSNTVGNEQLVFEWGDGTNAGAVHTTSVISTNQWHHVAATFARNVAGNGLDIRLYVDGVQDGQQLANPPSLGSLTNVVFLEIGDQPALDAPIALDELEIFNRALAAQEILDLFDAGSGGKCKPPTPTPTSSATPTDTPTPSPSPTASRTATPRATSTSSATPTPSATPSRTGTSTATRTATGSPTSTFTRTATSSATATPTVTVTPTCIPAPVSNHMVAWWPLDEQPGAGSVADIGLLPANTGVPQPGLIAASPPGGPLSVAGNLVGTPADSALYFYGQTVFVEVPSGPDLALAASDLTIDAWVKPLPGPWTASRDYLFVYPVIDKLDLTTNSGYAFYVEVQSSCPNCPPAGQQPPPAGVTSTTTMRLVFAEGNGTLLLYGSTAPFYIGSGKLFPFPTPPSALVPQPPGWTHVAVSVDRAQKAATFYSDGAQLGAIITAVAAGADNGDPLWIGGTRLYGTPHAPDFNEFTLNEIELFNAALSATDIQAIAGAGAGKCKVLPTPTATVSRTATRTHTASATSTLTPTRTPTATPSLTRTPVPTPTTTRTGTATRTPSITPTRTPPCITPPSDMVAWWTADNTANDLSGYGNHGTLHGAASYTAGMVGAAFSLPTIADYVEVPNAPTLNFSGNFSIDAWINTVNPTNARATILDKRSGTTTNPIGYTLFISSGLLGFQLADGQPFLNQVSPGPLIDDGAWHHVAATIDRTSMTGGNLYVDGQLVYTFDPTTRPGSIANTNVLRLGVRLIGSVQTFEDFQGAIDEVELFDRALGAQEVQAVYAAAAGGKCKTPLSTRTVTVTATRTPTRTSTASVTATPANSASSTRTRTLTPIPSSTGTASSTATATRTRTATPSPTATATATMTSVGCGPVACTPTATRTGSPTATSCVAELCAVKFLDQNHDGVRGATEPDIAGWLIHVADPSTAIVATLITGVNGCTVLPGLVTYTVSEVLQNGWTQTFPGPPGTHVVFLECGESLTLQFGNFENPTSTPTRTVTATATRTATRTSNIPPNT